MDEPSTAARRFMYLGVAAAFALAACSDRGTGTPMPPLQSPGERVAPQPAAGARAVAIVPIRWPKSAVAVRTRRGRQYVSPSTLGAIVTIRADASKVEAFANAGTSAVSRVRLQVPVGADDVTVALYDAKQTDAAHPNGNLVGAVSLVQTMAAGRRNVVNAVVNGVVRSVTIAPEGQQPYLERDGKAYAIVGQHASVFVVTPRDADGNAIVPPGITPSVTLQTDAKNSYYAVLAQAGPSHFTIAVTAQAPPQMHATFTARATDARDHTVSAKLTLVQRSEVFVAYASGRIVAFDDAGNLLALPAKAFSGLHEPVALAYDSSDRSIFVADESAGRIDAFTIDGMPLKGFKPPKLAGVSGVTWDANADMDEVAAVGNAAGIIVNSRTGGREGDTAVESPFTLAGRSTGIAYAPYPWLDLFLAADPANRRLDVYTTYGAVPVLPPNAFPIGPPSGSPQSVAVDPSGTIAWASGTAGSGGELWRVALQPPSSSGAASPPPEQSIADPNAPAGLAYDANLDRLFVAESATNTVAAYKSDLSAVDPSIVLKAPVSLHVAHPQGVAVAY